MRIAILAGLPLALGASAGAAQQQPSRPNDSTRAPASAPIPVSAIPQQALLVGRDLSELRTQVVEDTVAAGAEVALRDARKEIAAAQRAVTPQRLAWLSLGDFHDLEREWRTRDQQLGALQQRLAQRSSQMDAARDRLRDLRASWTLTRDSSAREDLTPELRERIRSVIARLDSAERSLNDPRDRLLALQDAAAEARVSVAEAIAELRAAAALGRRQLLRRDAPPLWRIASPTPPETRAAERRALGGLGAIREYVRAYPSRVWGQLLVFGGVLLVLYGLRKRAAGWASAQPGIAPPAALFAHPVSAAVIVTAALTRVLQPYAPSSVYDLAWAAALVPLWLLLPTLLGAAARRQASGLLALFVLNAVLQAVLGSAILLRLAFIALALLAGAVLLTVLRSQAAPARTSGWWRALLLATRVGLVALVAAIGANVLGFVELSGLLVRSTINIGTATIWLICVAAILGGVYVVAVEAMLARRLRAVRSHQARLVRHGLVVIHALAILLWLVIAARQLQILGPVLDAIGTALRREWSIGSWSPSLEEVLVFVVAIWVTVTVAAVTRALLREDVLPRMGLGRGPADAASSLVFYAAMALGLLFAIGAAGLQLSQLAFIVGALGVGIGFGLQNIVSNFISGLILLFERPIQVDDTIELESLVGNVKAIGIRASIVRTFEGAEVIVPNSDLIAGRVVNWTLSDQKRRMEVAVGVAHGTPPSRVLEILRSVPARHPRVLAEPAPLALFVGFGESSLDFVLWFWTANFGEWVQIRSDVYAGVYEALTEAGIKIPFPQRDLHLRSVEADAGRVLRGGA